MKRQALNEVSAKRSAIWFYEKKQDFEQKQKEFEEEKRRFYSEMDSYFASENISSKAFFYDGDTESLTVTRCQSKKVIFNPDILEKSLGKALAGNVIIKHYEIQDMIGLISYLKTCGVDPLVFKKFISVSKTVDEQELDRLFDIGKVTEEQVEGSFTVKKNNPYFTIRSGKAQVGCGEGESKWS